VGSVPDLPLCLSTGPHCAGGGGGGIPPQKKFK